jgi:methyl-accepting chemotaxis protein
MTKQDIKEILGKVSKEITEINTQITTTIKTENLNDSEVANWINNLNSLIRTLDHMVEKLEESQH